jgi:hypothetical protein
MNNNNNYVSSINVGFADRVVIHSYIDQRPVVVDQINVDKGIVVGFGFHTVIQEEQFPTVNSFPTL